MTHLLRLYVILTAAIINESEAIDLLQFIFGPRLHTVSAATRRDLYDHNDEVRAIAAKFGYPLEVHEVVTEDGYVLTLHRIPYNNRTLSPRKVREAVLIQPGFFGSSEAFMFRGPQVDLCYTLVDAGYDVWLGNPRGSHHSRSHLTLDPNSDSRYWNFTFHEMGMYDLPASINHILSTTKTKQIYFMGYSMGASAGYVLLSERPEFNDKIKLMSNLAGIAVVAHRLKPHLKLLMNSIPIVTNLCEKSNILELFPRRIVIGNVLKTVCQDGSPIQSLCLSLIYLITGKGVKQFSTVNIPNIFTYFPSGSSLHTMLHYYQIFTTGRFGPFDFYQSDTFSREYDLSRITVPVSLHYGSSDILNTKQDNLATAKRLKNVIGVFRVPFSEFNHMDFMWAKDAKKLLYDQLLILMDKLR